ncbi:hypothetical protein A8B83_18925 [Rhodobacteraceae bacterium EhC02]|nr:hypothetical protein A8B83_18925 [Rhodobacteraceae bacterium EhC02]
MTKIEIPLAFRERPVWPKDEPAPCIGYTVEPYQPQPGRSVQKVLTGRKLLRPLIDLNAYVCRAEIDWLELRLVIPAFRQARNLQPAIARMLSDIGSDSTVFVSGPDRRPGYMGSDFILKFQQPNPRELGHVLAKVAGSYGLDSAKMSELQIMGVEISVDFYVKGTGGLSEGTANLKRWQMVDILRRHLKPDPVLTELPAAGPRFYGGKFGGGGATHFVNPSASDLGHRLLVLAPGLGLEPESLVALDLNKHSQPDVDATSWIGAKDFHVMLRTMDKVTDQRDPASGTFLDLSKAERRARVEVTLQGKVDEVGGHGAVGLKTLGDLAGFPFKTIRRTFFEFYLATLGEQCDGTALGIKLRANEEEIFRRSGVYGLDRFHRTVQMVNKARIAKGEQDVSVVRLGEKGRMLSWMDMNQKIDRALKKLGKDWGALF